MFASLKNHPFAVEAYFDSSIVLTYAVPKHELLRFLPECLELDAFEAEWGFVAVAMVQTRSLRPRGLPTVFGNDFFLIGYRIFVRYASERGNHLRGLYILGSQTDSRRMELFGDIFTHYKYSTIDIATNVADGMTTISSRAAGLEVVLNMKEMSPPLPAGSPFPSWKEARRFAGPMPFTFSYDAASKRVLIIEGVRQNWNPRPIEVVSQSVEFFRKVNILDFRLANAFVVENVPYFWKKGRIEKWNG